MPDIDNFGKPKDNVPRVMDTTAQIIPPPSIPSAPSVVVPAPQPEKKDTDVGKEYITKSELQAELNNLARAIVAQITNSRNITEGSVALALREINQRIIQREEIKKIAKDAVPATIRDIDSSASQRAGNVLMLSSGGASGRDSVYFGTPSASGLTAKGDKVLYKGVFLREHDENGTIVAVGSEINPADYATQALYDAALVAAGHTLRATWDWARSGSDTAG